MTVRVEKARRAEGRIGEKRKIVKRKEEREDEVNNIAEMN